MDREKILDFLLRILLVLSTPFFTLLVLSSAAGEVGYVVTLVLSVAVAVAVSGKVAELICENFKWYVCLTSFGAATYLVYRYVWQGNGIRILNEHHVGEIIGNVLHISVNNGKMVLGLMIASYPAVFMLLYCVFVKISSCVIEFIKSLDWLEWAYLGILFGIGIFAFSFFYGGTTVCYHAETDGVTQLYDVLYTTDSAEIYEGDAYLSILAGPNDIRQPLFGLFAMPFALLCHLFSAIFFFVPNSYAVAWGILQFILEGVSVIMLMRMLCLRGKKRICFAFAVQSSYSYIIYAFILEQYVIAYFYLILTLYVYQQGKNVKYAYFGAVSTLLPSGVLFPLLSKKKKRKEKMADWIQCMLQYFGIVVVCGQLPQFLGISGKVEMIMAFTGEKVGWQEKWIQFTHFFSSMFIAPQAGVQNVNFISYKMDVFENISYFGIIIFICAVFGFMVSCREWISVVAFWWVLFSMFILFVVGWGTAENGLLLYALYFVWAYLILLYQLLRKIFHNSRWMCGAISCIGLVMAFWNTAEMIRIYQFGVMYYPA